MIAAVPFGKLVHGEIHVKFVPSQKQVLCYQWQSKGGIRYSCCNRKNYLKFWITFLLLFYRWLCYSMWKNCTAQSFWTVHFLTTIILQDFITESSIIFHTILVGMTQKLEETKQNGSYCCQSTNMVLFSSVIRKLVLELIICQVTTTICDNILWHWMIWILLFYFSSSRWRQRQALPNQLHC